LLARRGRGEGGGFGKGKGRTPGIPAGFFESANGKGGGKRKKFGEREIPQRVDRMFSLFTGWLEGKGKKKKKISKGGSRRETALAASFSLEFWEKGIRKRKKTRGPSALAEPGVETTAGKRGEGGGGGRKKKIGRRGGRSHEGPAAAYHVHN